MPNIYEMPTNDSTRRKFRVGRSDSAFAAIKAPQFQPSHGMEFVRADAVEIREGLFDVTYHFRLVPLWPSYRERLENGDCEE